MAIFYLNAAIVSRGKAGNTVKSAAHHSGKSSAAKGGKSAIDKAAYNSRSALTDEKTGETFDYGKRFGGSGSEIRLPNGSQPWMADRQKLWNAIERIENRKDSQLAKDFIFNLPYELTKDERRAAVRDFVDEQFVSKGKPVDIGYHDYGDPYPANSPVIGTYITEWKAKGWVFYERDNLPVSDTKPHIAILRGKDGEIEGYSVHQPHAHALTTFRSVDPEYHTGFARLKDRTPEGEHPAAYWEAELIRLRAAWAETLNKHLEMAGSHARVTHLSLEDQGIKDRKPEPKKGPLATKMEREGRGHESKAVLEWLKVRTGNEIVVLDRQIEQLTTQEKRRKKVMSESADPSSREYAIRQQRGMDGQIKSQKDVLGLDKLEQGRRFYEQIEIQAQEGERLRREDLATRTKDTDITDASERFMLAASERFDIRRPEATMSEAVGLEGARAKEEHRKLTKEAAGEKDEDKKRDILLRRDIMHADYMSITSMRLVGIHGYNEGANPRVELDMDGKPIPMQRESEVQQAKADYWAEQATKLREEREKLAINVFAKSIDHFHNKEDMARLNREMGFDPNRMEPGRYRPLDHHLERTKGIIPELEKADPAEDRREMHRAMQTERQITDPRHEVTGRIAQPAREMTDKEQARQAARVNYARVMSDSSGERDQIDGKTHAEAKSSRGRSL